MYFLRGQRRVEKLTDVLPCRGSQVLNIGANTLLSRLRAESTSSKIIAGMAIFWVFAACMAALAGITLVWRGTMLDKVWALNKPAYAVLSPIAGVVGPLFLVLSAIMVSITMGWLRRKLWAWWLALIVLGTQIIGDIVNLVRGDLLRGIAGVVIASALLFLLAQREVRDQFS